MKTHHNGDADKELHSVLRDLRKDIDALRSDFASLSSDTVALGKTGARSLSHTVGDRIDAIASKAKSTVSATVDGVEGSAKNLRETISDNPLASLGVAATIGFLLGRGMLKP
jgi:ElaB/YqjD/DUF883 family membrane-anchored ribosome-binding protein